ncbi:MAG: hypothetical protein AAF193_02875, partial [Bacteroidota bacterium]
MMNLKTWIVSGLFIFLGSVVYSQEDAATALPLDQYYYFLHVPNNSPCPPTPGVLGTSGSGEATCSGVDN